MQAKLTAAAVMIGFALIPTAVLAAQSSAQAAVGIESYRGMATDVAYWAHGQHWQHRAYKHGHWHYWN